MGSELLYAPAFRLTASASRQLVDVWFGAGLLVVIAVAVILAWQAYARAAKLRGEVWKRHGLRAGPILIGGVAEPVDEEKQAAEQQAAAFAPFVELTIHQHGEQRQTRNGRYVLWKETSRHLSERPFVLRTDEGTRLRVEPTGRIELVDRLESPVRTGKERTRVARIVPGERIWVRGELVGEGGDSGPYRGGAGMRTLRPAANAPLLICSQPIDGEDAGTGRFHAKFAVVFTVLIAFCQLVLFSTYRTLRRSGVASTATIVGKRQWITRNKNNVTHHYGFALAPDGTEEEVSSRAYQVRVIDDQVPVVRAPNDPSRLQVGPPEEVGVTSGPIAFAIMLTIGALFVWIITKIRRRPWWRSKVVNDTENGSL